VIKKKELNLNAILIISYRSLSEEDFQKILKEKFGEKGHIVQKQYYKESKYLSEMEVGPELGYQVYNPEDGLLYSWQQGTEAVVTLDSKKYMD